MFGTADILGKFLQISQSPFAAPVGFIQATFRSFHSNGRVEFSWQFEYFITKWRPIKPSGAISKQIYEPQ